MRETRCRVDDAQNMKLFMKLINNFNTIKIRNCYEDASKTLIKYFHNKIVFLFFSFSRHTTTFLRMYDRYR